jgi:hypothetical protein
MDPSGRKTRLTRLCERRWVEKQDAALQFKELFAVIVEALRRLHQSHDGEESAKASRLCAVLETSGFIVALNCITFLFGMCKGLSELLQSPQMDLSSCVKHAELLLQEVRSVREKAESSFHAIFSDASDLAEEIGSEIKIPRVASRQKYRDSYASASPEEYYRIAVFIPLLEDFASQLDTRFVQHREALTAFSGLSPRNISSADDVGLDELASSLLERFAEDLPCTADGLKGELRMWRRRWNDVQEPPSNFIEMLNECPTSIWPSLHRVIKIAAVLPVSVATNERSFSTLRRLKTYLRSTTGETRLNGLALLNVHREVGVTPDEILDEMARVPRRLDIVL